jgi:hypothetical protein
MSEKEGGGLPGLACLSGGWIGCCWSLDVRKLRMYAIGH